MTAEVSAVFFCHQSLAFVLGVGKSDCWEAHIHTWNMRNMSHPCDLNSMVSHCTSKNVQKSSAFKPDATLTQEAVSTGQVARQMKLYDSVKGVWCFDVPFLWSQMFQTDTDVHKAAHTHTHTHIHTQRKRIIKMHKPYHTREFQIIVYRERWTVMWTEK